VTSLFVLAGVLVVAGTAFALFCARHRRVDRRWLMAMINGWAIASLGVVLFVVGSIRASR
jgi:hypothetical protein